MIYELMTKTLLDFVHHQTKILSIHYLRFSVTASLLHFNYVDTPLCAFVKFSSEQFPADQQSHKNGIRPETSTDAEYQNCNPDGDPIPGHSRGVVPHKRNYVNTEPSRSLWYDRLQLFRPSAIGWLRNAWGNVDENGHHVYDVMQRVKQIFVPYDKLELTALDDSGGRRMETSDSTYDTPQRPAAVILPCADEISTTEIA